RLKTPDGFERKLHRADLTWRNVELFADRDRRLWLVGVDSTRKVWVKRWTPQHGWRPFVEVATGWSQDTTPSMAIRPGGGVSLVGVDTGRRLEQHDWTAAGGWVETDGHGGGWERATMVTARGHQWLLGVRPDGDILARAWTEADGWSEFEGFGTGDWAVSVPPAAAVRTDGTLSVFAVKADGRMFHRSWKAATGWKAFWSRGIGERWLSVEAAFSDGTLGYAGQTYDRRLVSGFWRGGEGWVEGVSIGGPEWSALRPVGFGVRSRGGLTLLGVTSAGELLHRHWTPARGWFAEFGRPGGMVTWAKA
ncbi:MAG: hypothetical protein R3246_15600, partial [Acidimicrobiia bacterium]|nr:hypothetical protein [Acidimicrobiia bacterium]